MSTTLRARSALLSLSVLLVLTGCGATAPDAAAPPASSSAADQLLAPHGLSGLSTREVIEQLEATPVAERATDLVASVRPDVLLLAGPDGEETTMPLPEGEFSLSFAPYVEKNHDCFFHSLTTCLGELRNETVEVVIVDASGEVLVNESLRTNDNGFIGVWLPKDAEFELTVRYAGKSVTSSVSTDAESPTCLTTLQLT